MTPPKKGFEVDGIVAARDKQPYVRLFVDGKPIAQLSIAQARNIAADIMQTAARTEADAMILKFFEKAEFPAGAAAALMLDFREFRLALDTEWVERSATDPDKREQTQ
jgi:hypothetical protein